MISSGAEAADRKQRIRDRYKGVDTSELEVIPAKTVEGLGESTSIRRVAAYVRVSTDNDEQTSSYELQKNYYTDYIKAQPGWEFVGIYDDATVIIGLKQNPTIGRRFSPIFLLKSGILRGKTQNATTKQGGKLNMVWAKAFAVCLDNERLFLYPQNGGIYERNNYQHSLGRASPISRPPFRSARR